MLRKLKYIVVLFQLIVGCQSDYLEMGYFKENNCFRLRIDGKEYEYLLNPDTFFPTQISQISPDSIKTIISKFNSTGHLMNNSISSLDSLGLIEVTKNQGQTEKSKLFDYSYEGFIWETRIDNNVEHKIFSESGDLIYYAKYVNGIKDRDMFFMSSTFIECDNNIAIWELTIELPFTGDLSFYTTEFDFKLEPISKKSSKLIMYGETECPNEVIMLVEYKPAVNDTISDFRFEKVFSNMDNGNYSGAFAIKL